MKKIIYVRLEEMASVEFCGLLGSLGNTEDYNDLNINLGTIPTHFLPHICEAFKDHIIVIFTPFTQNSLDIFLNPYWESQLFLTLIKFCKQYNNIFIYTGNDWDDVCYKHNEKNIPEFIVETFAKARVSLSRLIWSMNNPYMMEILDEIINREPSNPRPLVFYNNYYLKRFKNLKPEYKISLDKHGHKNKHFLMTNRRASAHRLTLSAYLYKYHKDRIHLSFNNASDNPDATSMPELMPIDIFYNRDCETTFNGFKTLVSENDLTNFVNQWPLRLDYDGSGNFPLKLQDSLDTKFIYDSACHIVGETYFNELWSHSTSGHSLISHEFQGFFTEKSLKPFLWGLPAIWLSLSNTLESLKKIGFKTFDGMIDESYDKIEDRHERFSAILSEIEKISKITDINGWYNQGTSIYEHNFNLLQEYINRDNFAIVRNHCEQSINLSNHSYP